MELIYYNSQTKIQPESAATIGVFDGVHKGHKAVVAHTQAIARSHRLKSMVITFDRLPRQLFDPSYHPQLLTTTEEKAGLLQALGVDIMVVLPFTTEMASLTAREFMELILRRQLNVSSLITGYDNRFGSGRTDTYEDYQAYGRQLGIHLDMGPEVTIPGFAQPVSSSLIRRLIADEGRMSDAALLLGRQYRLTGIVATGEHIGTQLGFPTANLQPDDRHKLIPASGAYAVTADLGDGKQRPAMMNIGTRPTFSGHSRTLEVHIINYSANLYGQPMTVSFVTRLRDEFRFDTPEALASQLAEDKKKALEYINRK